MLFEQKSRFPQPDTSTMTQAAGGSENSCDSPSLLYVNLVSIDNSLTMSRLWKILHLDGM